MSASELNGALVASKLLTDTAQRVELLKHSSGKVPCLATVLVGAAAWLTRQRVRAASATGQPARGGI